jgi:hypothetical protein
VRLAVPPYGTWLPESGAPRSIPFGALVLLRYDLRTGSLGQRLGPLTAQVAALRRAAPSAIIGCTLDGFLLPDARGAFRVLESYGVRLLADDDGTPAPLLSQARSLRLNHRGIETWMRHVLRPRGVHEFGVLSQLARLTSGQLLDPGERDELRRFSREVGLPTMRRWLAFGRVLRPVLDLQSVQNTRVADVAERHGYPDPSSFSHACRRSLLLPPSQARKYASWEPLLTAFLIPEAIPHPIR